MKAQYVYITDTMAEKIRQEVGPNDAARFAAMADYARKLERLIEAYDDAINPPVIEDYNDEENYDLACNKYHKVREDWLDIKNEVCR